ncbi:hypothetical protein [Asticcacaulis sp. 201]|uniref:hypothetical protein n=1 Tax=Asticcacaulis sp. 201 TaxID=3028787 RepID=UPI0029164F24|nr:hypothetical protein [Asticcacaulis sp. 201]MDV6331078.1 hypothetical protein [Asticcacaulis sp. 201]
MDFALAKMRMCTTVMRVATFIAATVCAVAFWQAALPLSGPIVFPFSETYYARATASPSPADKIIWAQKAVDAAPRRAENWLLLAYAYQSVDHTVSPRAIGALRQSYSVAPFSPDAHDGRLQVVFSNWGAIPADIRRTAIREANLYVTREAGLTFMKKLAPTLHDANAKFAANLIVRARESRKEADWALNQTNINN